MKIKTGNYQISQNQESDDLSAIFCYNHFIFFHILHYTKNSGRHCNSNDYRCFSTMRHRGLEPDYYSKKLEKKGLAAHHSFSVIKMKQSMSIPLPTGACKASGDLHTA